MGCLSWVIFGLLAGYIAKALLPGKDPGGIIATLLIGVCGAVLGGFLATLLGFGGVGAFNLTSLATATVGSVILLLLWRLVGGGKKKR